MATPALSALSAELAISKVIASNTSHCIVCAGWMLVVLQRPGPKPSPQPPSGVGGREQMKADRIKAAADARQAKELAKARAQQVGGCQQLHLGPYAERHKAQGCTAVQGSLPVPGFLCLGLCCPSAAPTSLLLHARTVVLYCTLLVHLDDTQIYP